MRWTGLDVLDRAGGGLFDTEGVVEFHAHHRTGARPQAAAAAGEDFAVAAVVGAPVAR